MMNGEGKTEMERRKISMADPEFDAVVGGAGLDTFGGRKITETDTVLCAFRCWTCGHEETVPETGTNFLTFANNRLTAATFATRNCPNCQAGEFLFEQVTDVQY